MSKINSLKILFCWAASLYLSSCNSPGDQVQQFKPRWDRVAINPESLAPVKLRGLFVDGQISASGDCLSWATACKTVSEAITKSRGEDIYVGAGVYKSPGIKIRNRRKILLIGGYKAGELHEKKRSQIKEEDWAVLDGEGFSASLVEISGRSESIHFNGGFKFINVKDGAALQILGASASKPVKNVTISYSSFENNKNLKGDGGAIFAKWVEQITFNNVDATENHARNGGFFFGADLRELKVNGGVWHKNVALKKRGGAFYAARVDGAVLSPTTLSHNSAFLGGALFLSEFKAGGSLAHADVSDNESQESGAGIYLHKMNGFRVSHTKFSGNVAQKYGGAVFVTTSKNIDFNFQKQKVSQNSAKAGGGAIMLLKSEKISLVHGDFLQNGTSMGEGGALYSREGAGLTITDSIFSENQAEGKRGGAISIWQNSGQVTVENSQFLVNNTLGFGGALSLEGALGSFAKTASVKFVSNTFRGNTSTDSGGAAYLYRFAGQAEFLGKNLFEKNKARKFGGALALDARSSDTAEFVIGEHTLFYNNTAEEDYGGGAIVMAVAHKAALPATPRLVLNNFHENYQGNNAGAAVVSRGMMMSFFARDLDDITSFNPAAVAKYLSLRPILQGEKIIHKFVGFNAINVDINHESEIFFW